MKPRDLTLSDIQVGDTASFSRTFTASDVEAFAELSGDVNPLHMDETYAKGTKFGRRLVHGMLVVSLSSTLVGMYLPGKRCLYVGQTFIFKKPVFIGDTVTITGTVVSKSASTAILELSISITKETEEVVAGKASVQVL